MRLAALLFASVLVSKDAPIEIPDWGPGNKVWVLRMSELAESLPPRNGVDPDYPFDVLETALTRFGKAGWRLDSIVPAGGSFGMYGEYDLIFTSAKGPFRYEVCPGQLWDCEVSDAITKEESRLAGAVGGAAADVDLSPARRSEIRDEVVDSVLEKRWREGWRLVMGLEQVRRLGSFQVWVK